MKIWIYWSESNPWIYFYIVLKKLKKLLVRTKFDWFWTGGLVLVLIVRTVIMYFKMYVCRRSRKVSHFHSFQGIKLHVLLFQRLNINKCCAAYTKCVGHSNLLDPQMHFGHLKIGWKIGKFKVWYLTLIGHFRLSLSQKR